LLRILLNKFNRVFIVLDAVDESQNREELLRVLTAISRFPNVRLLATSRNYYDIETSLADISMSVSMSNQLVDQDIRLAVRSKLRRSKRLQKWRKFFPEMEDAITNGVQGMYVFPRRLFCFCRKRLIQLRVVFIRFRWAVCQLHILERLQPTTDLHEELRNLPPDLDAAYQKIFLQIPDQHRRVVRKVLLWIFGHDGFILAEPNVTFTDAPIPMAILVEGTSADLYERQCLGRDAHDAELVRDLCGCLIDIHPRIMREYDLETWQEPNKDTQREMVEVVSCAHYTVKEYLYSQRSEWRLKSCCGTIPVILASTLASPDCFEWFLECAGRDIDATSMLVNLIRPPDFAVTVIGFNRLLKLGADPNADGYALTPLQLAAWAEITKQLRCSLTMVPTAMQKGRKGGRQWPSSRKIFRTCVPSTF
jgi:hypothetical protein